MLEDYFGHFYEFVMDDEVQELTPEYASETVRRFFDLTGPHAATMKAANLPPSMVIIQRINLGLYALFGELHASANWRRIAEELWPFALRHTVDADGRGDRGLEVVPRAGRVGSLTGGRIATTWGSTTCPSIRELQPFLDLVNAAEVPIRDLGAAGLREQMDGMVAMFGSGPEVASVDDRTIPGPGGEIPVRIYRPLEPVGRPARRGGVLPRWRLRDREPRDPRLDMSDPLCRGRRGRRVGRLPTGAGASVPRCSQDCLAALRLGARHADDLGVAAARIAVAGDSAGGQPGRGRGAIRPEARASRSAFQLLVYPVVDLDETSEAYPSRAANAEGYLLTQDTMVFFGACYLSDPSDRRRPSGQPDPGRGSVGAGPGARDHRRVRPAVRRGRGVRQGTAPTPGSR